MKPAVLFDLDGTLVDTMPFYETAWVKAFEMHGVTIPGIELYEREGEKTETTAIEMFTAYGGRAPTQDEVRAIILRRDEVYKAVFILAFYPDTLTVLGKLKDAGFQLAIVTGSPGLTPELEQHPEFRGAFSAVITGNDVRVGKPAPEPYLLAAEKLALDPRNCIAVENAPLGVRSAITAGCRCIAVRGTSPLPVEALYNAGAHEVFEQLSEVLPGLIGEP